LNIYPNPVTSGYVYVKASGINELVTVEVITVTGQLVKQIGPVDLSTIQKIDMSGMSKGIYLIQIFNDNYQYVRRIVVR